MYTVKPEKQQYPDRRTICSGVMFGYFEQPLFFQVTSDLVLTPYPVQIIVSLDKTRENFFIQSKSLDPVGTQITFFNPFTPGVNGLYDPLSIIGLRANNNEFKLGVMFYVDTLTDSKSYRLTYEFYEWIVPITSQETEVKK